MTKLTDEELAEIRERVEEAKPDGQGVGKLALEDVPKLLAEIERLKRDVELAKHWWDYYGEKYAELFDEYVIEEVDSE